VAAAVVGTAAHSLGLGIWNGRVRLLEMELVKFGFEMPQLQMYFVSILSPQKLI
jgi:hypothetical protein